MPTGDVLDHKSCLDGVAFINDEDFFKKTYTFMNSSSGWSLGVVVLSQREIIILRADFISNIAMVGHTCEVRSESF